jgi:lipopolysaccharide transport system ATP-binding protein
MKGRVASLLEVGTGFHPELTGRENIFLNGSILGMRKHEIARKLDEIIEFSGVERYIDTPVKRYSSGMYVRLAFAVAAHLESEILIVDEVLAVGDAEFQKKCLGRMKDVSVNEGRTVLFVSHNMASVKSLCTESLILLNGAINYLGGTATAIQKYLSLGSVGDCFWQRTENSNSALFINEVFVCNESGNPVSVIESENDFQIKIKLVCMEVVKNATVAIRFSSFDGTSIFTTDLHDQIDTDYVFNPGIVWLTAIISKNILVPGNYRLTISVHQPRVYQYDCVADLLSISIENLRTRDRDIDREGYVIPRYKWIINDTGE